MDNKNKEYYSVPIYIEKIIKKLFKTRNQQNELVSQVRDYMHHDIPLSTPLTLLKYIPEEEINPNQMSIFETNDNKDNQL